jgi:hypothetical protein
MAETTTCPRCETVYHDYLDDERFRSGAFSEDLPDGTTVTYDTLCEDCHRDVVRS